MIRHVCWLGVTLAMTWAVVAEAVPMGKLQGKIVGTDTGEPIGFADIMLIPVDTTLSKVGGQTNADGTFLLAAAPGRYAFQVRALSYAHKRVENIVLRADELVPLNLALSPEAIQQKGIEVTAKAVTDNEAALLSARKKAAAVGDAISAEQVRKSPDKDAAEVLKRVTGLSVSDGKYVFVRGLGERYSSVEVDGVRIASPEQNKRVVPLDLVPAQLLDNITVQKTYTADRPGEFGGGDVQVRTRDFPGKRIWQFRIAQGYSENVTFDRLATYRASRMDIFGYGSGSRQIPKEVYVVAGDQPLLRGNFSNAQLADVARSFQNIWSPYNQRTIPNGSYQATYGDEFKMFGHSLGVITSWNLNRWFDQTEGSQRYFQSSLSDTVYDYNVSESKESVQLGGLGAISYRFSPRHTIHLRGLYTNSADDEVRIYQGVDHNRQDVTGDWIHHHDTRFLYVQRDVLSGTLNGQHTFPSVLNSAVDWKVTRSRAQRQQPDRRELSYDRNFYDDGTGHMVEYWALSSNGQREYGDLKDDGKGGTITGSVPYKLFALGAGKVVLGYDRQIKTRTNFYRRFHFKENRNADTTLPPDSLFSPTQFTGDATTGYVEEATLAYDNYDATQRTTAGFLAMDVPMGEAVRVNLGVRRERGIQNVRSFDLFDRSLVTAEGSLDDTDWLPSGNVTWAVTKAVNLRLGASRTISRPDLNELSPSPALEYVGGFRVAGNPELQRAKISNYDVRVEAFPGLSEVLAAGVFYKYLSEPIEQQIQGGDAPLLVPRNSDHGRNQGVELEARAGLGRLWRRLSGLSLNSNASFISSKVMLKPQTSRLGTAEHPLQGQAQYLLNVGLGYSVPRRAGLDMSLLFSSVGKRLRTLAYDPLPDIYDDPITNIDASMGFNLLQGGRMKLSARNLSDPIIRQVQGGKEVGSTRAGRSYSVEFSYAL
jgi:outer membrane receptor protein involved in Fe transport